MSNYKLGAPVRQIVKAPIEGVITKFIPDEITRTWANEVSWTDADGNVHSKVFQDDEIELLPNPDEPNPTAGA